MKALVLKTFNAPLEMEEVETPSLDRADILLRVQACGICGTDLKIVSGKLPPGIVSLPHIPGHEIAGEVVQVGSAIEHIQPGQNGIAYLYQGCRDCEMCRSGHENVCFSVKRLGFELPGGFAEYVKMPAYNFCPYGEALDACKMAVLPDAVATSYHAVLEIGDVRPGDTVLIIGCGGLGIHALQIAKLAGAVAIVADVRKASLRLAETFGADYGILPSETDPRDTVMEITGGRGVDVVIENVGTEQTIQWSLPCLKRRGRLVLVGYDPSRPAPLSTLAMHYNEWEIRGTRLSTKQELLEVIRLVENRKITPVVSDVLPWQEADTALSRLEQGTVVGRMVLSIDP